MRNPIHQSRNGFRTFSVTDRCAACGKRRLGRRSDAKYCSNACRQRAYRCRKYPTAENEWYTPAWVMKLVRQVMGSITLDPASCAAAQEVVQADVFFTVKEDGLSRSWFGNAWLSASTKASCW